MLNSKQRRQAIYMYEQCGLTLSEIAQHFGLCRDQLVKQIKTN